MKNQKIIVAGMILLGFMVSSFTLVDLDPAYLKAFGYGSICVSGKGYPKKDKYDPSQFDFNDGKFYIQAGRTIDLRAFLPQGKTYGSLVKSFTGSHPKYGNMVEDQIYWKIYSNYDKVGNKLFDKWESDPVKMLHQNNPLCFIPLNTQGAIQGWNTAGVDWNDTENNDLQRDVGNWLETAKPGWQLYILHTVGFRRNCPEDKYWDVARQEYIIPVAFEMARPIAFCIAEVKE